MYHVTTNYVYENNPIYPYMGDTSHASNNLYNAVLFRVRQVLTATSKPKKEWTPNEKEVMDEIANALPRMGKGFKMPSKGKHFLGYNFLDKLMRVTRNPDFFDKRISRQTAQHAIKHVVQDMKSFYGAIKAWKEAGSDPKKKPKLPRYKTKGGLTSVEFTNQDCVAFLDKGMAELKFPYTKERLKIGKVSGNLKSVTLSPSHGMFIIHAVFEDDDIPSYSGKPSRICTVDVGVNNTAAIANNAGLPCLLFKGGIAKSVNQLYNKKMAEARSAKDKKLPCKIDINKECIYRESLLTDFMHKVAKRTIEYCVNNNLDTLVIGHSNGWKQDSHLGKQNNQNFVQLPFNKLINNLSCLCEKHGIYFMVQEESYTSKASYLDKDDIPVYGQEKGKPVFSGRRIKRGLYKSSDGTVINADLNGAANIGRKAFPELFDKDSVCFTKPTVLRVPDEEFITRNREKQKKLHPKMQSVSKSCMRRRNRKK